MATKYMYGRPLLYSICGFATCSICKQKRTKKKFNTYLESLYIINIHNEFCGIGPFAQLASGCKQFLS